MTEWKRDSIGNGRIAKGYHVNLPVSKPTQESCNGYLINQQGEELYLWVTDIEASFRMNGTFAQSATVRDWYSRNLEQPRLTLSGQVANSHEYQRLGEFVRESHLNALNPKLDAKQLITLHIKKGGIKAMGKNHQPWKVLGYIRQMTRGAERFVNAPTWTFDFIVATGNGPLFKDGNAATSGAGKELWSILDWTKWNQTKNPKSVGEYVESDPDFDLAKDKEDLPEFSFWGETYTIGNDNRVDDAIQPVRTIQQVANLFDELWENGAPRYDDNGNPLDAGGGPVPRYP